MLAYIATPLFLLLMFCLPGSGFGEEGYPYILRSAKVPGYVRDLVVTQSRPNLIFAAVIPQAKPNPEEKYGLYIFEIGGSGELREVSSYPIKSPTAIAITPNGKTLFVQNTRFARSADQVTYGGILAIDVSSPERPTLLSTLEVNSARMHLSWDGQILFVQQGPLNKESKERIQIYDVSDPRNAVLRAVIPTKAPAYGMLLMRNRRLVVQDASDTLSIFDVADPSNPHTITEQRSKNLGSVLLEPSPGVLYASGSGGFKVLETEQSLREVGAYTETVPLSMPYISSNGRRMIFDSSRSHITTLDISDPARPKTALRFTVPTYPGSVVLAEKHGFIVVGLVRAVAIIDEKRLMPTVEGLVTSHEKALAAFKKAGSQEPLYKVVSEALRMLEAGGIHQAMQRKPEGLRTRRYAQILNDYAFLKLQISPTDVEATSVFRKVISLDPSRSVAFLSLGQALQAQLRLLTTYDQKVRSTEGSGSGLAITQEHRLYRLYGIWGQA